MKRLTGIAAAALSVFLLALAPTATHAQHQGPPTAPGDQLLEAACRDIRNARTRPDLEKVAAASQSNVNIAQAQAMQKVSSAQQKEKEAAAALSAAKAAAAQAADWISKVRQGEQTAKDYERRGTEARQKIAAIQKLQRDYQAAEQAVKQHQDRVSAAGQSMLADLKQTAAGFKQQLDASDITAERNKAKLADDLLKGTPRGDLPALREQLKKLEEKEKEALAAHEAEKKNVTAAQRDLSTVFARRTEVARCVAERSAQLDPTLGPQLAYLDAMLARIETRLGEFEKRAPQMALGCDPILKEIQAIQGDGAALGRDADALAAKAATPQAGAAGYQGRERQASQAALDARRAATAISNGKTQAAKAATDACQVSDAIVKNPGIANASARLADVQRNRADAERAVAETAAALDRIRAAHASAQAAGSMQTPLTQELSFVKTRADNLKRRRDATAEKATEFSDFSLAINLVLKRLELANNSATADSKNPSANVYRLRATRIADLLSRTRKIDRTCASRISPAFIALDKALNDAGAKITSAAQAIAKTGVLADPPNYIAEIERIFNAARTEAEAVAAEATKAVRCEAAARNALNNPPVCKGAPPPGAALKPDRPGGLTCKYQCGSSHIEFTTYDTTTCVPKIEDYTLVSSSRSPAGKLVQSGAAVVKKGTSGKSGVVESLMEFTATTARQVEIDGTIYRREISWTFTAPPASLSPGEEIRIDVSGKAEVTDRGTKVKLPTAPSAGVRVRGLEPVNKAELAWANTGEGKASTFVFRVPADAKGATIEFGADWNMGIFATYYYGDHKKP